MAPPGLYQPNAPPLPSPDYQPLPGDSSDHRSPPPSQLDNSLPSASVPAYGPNQPYGSFQNFEQYGSVPSGSYPLYDPAYAAEGSTAFGFPVVQDLPPEWSTRLCNCCADVPICLLGCFFPCVLFGKNAERLDDGMTSCATASIVWYLLQQFTCCGWIYSWGYRRKLRSKYNLPQSPLPDCLVHFCCWPCAICQEHRELHIRRLREEAAWTRRAVMAAPPQQTMHFQR